MNQKRIVGVVDYGVGNHASVVHALKTLGYLTCLSHDVDILSQSDTLLLPGVGSFSVAMDALRHYGLVPFLRKWVHEAHPLIGICLGMQLLATSGTEGVPTLGLDLIPGEVSRLESGNFHIGWNNLIFLRHDDMFARSDGRYFYFNHSYVFRTNTDAIVAYAQHGEVIPSIVRNGSVIGLQFHPEKSQAEGLMLLRCTLEGY